VSAAPDEDHEHLDEHLDLDDDHHLRVTLEVSMLGLTAISWVVLIPAVLCWPVVVFILLPIWRSSKRHEAEEKAQREKLLEDARSAEHE
jgi:hypothetical protein